MKWLERAAREFSPVATTSNIKTIETQVLKVLKVPHSDISQKTESDTSLPTGACAACAHFRPALDKTPEGWCRKYRTETWGQYANGCANGWTPADPAAQVLELRRREVVERLEADPSLRYWFDVASASPTGPAAADVRVLIGLRDRTGRIVTGEVYVPSDRWPGIALFNEFWRKAALGILS